MVRRIAIVVFEGVQSLDVVGPLEVFATASRLAPRPPAYSISIVAPRAGAIRSSNGLVIGAGRLASVPSPLDTMIVAGGPGSRKAAGDPALLRTLARLAKRSRRVASVCTGAFVLAALGLLDGKRATTHWAACDELADEHPDVQVERDPIFVREGRVFTSAGVTAGMDLALALVEDDLGPEIALAVARWLVMFVQRPGGQSQFSAALAADRARSRPIRDVQGFVAGNLDADLSVDALARRAGMSPRHFARKFADEVGEPPGAFVERCRIEAARRILETSAAGLAEIARDAGFGTVETFHRAFRRAQGISPHQYRERFASRSAATPERRSNEVRR